MESSSLKRRHEKHSGAAGLITYKRKYFINRARAGRGGAAEMFEREPEEGGVCADEEAEPLSVGDYQTLLQLLNINLPAGALTPDAAARSTHTDVIKDSKAILRDLRKAKLTVVDKPRVSCVKVKQTHDLKEKGNITHITQSLFFKPRRRGSERTLKERWETNASKAWRGFRMRDTFTETPTSTPEKSSDSTGRAKASFGIPAENRNNETDCFRFFLQEKGLDIEDVTYKRERVVESGFISGRLDFLLDVRNPPESTDVSPSEKIIIECKGTKGNMVGDVFTLPQGEGHRVELNKSHDYYYQTQAYLHILKRELSPVPVRAVIVVKLAAEDTNPKFYWGEVSEDTERIEKLNDFCQEVALPRFLAVLSLIFQKVEEREEARVMERDEKMEREETMERDEKMEREEKMERDEKMEREEKMLEH